MDSKLPNQPANEGDGRCPGSEPMPIAEIFGYIETVGKKLARLVRDTTAEAGLTPAQYSILTLLSERDGRTFKELAAAHHCSPATMTGIVDVMEEKGLVTREPNPGDRRSLLARLTPEGRTLQEVTPGLDRVFRSCCVGLEPEEFQQLGRLLVKLDRSLSPRKQVPIRWRREP